MRTVRELLEELGTDAATAIGMRVGKVPPPVGATYAIVAKRSRELAENPEYWATNPGHRSIAITGDEMRLLIENGAKETFGGGNPADV